MEEKNLSTVYIGNSDERFFSMAIDDEGRHYVLEGTKNKLYELERKNISIDEAIWKKLQELAKKENRRIF